MAVSTSTWISFFKDAGIPAGVAASYALTFYDNRIQMDMLLELNKEYLRDMGITLMGDVIAILRHAKRVHEQTAREKILGHSSSRTMNVGASQTSKKIEDEAVKKPRTLPETFSPKKTTRVISQPVQPANTVKKKVVKTKQPVSSDSSEDSPTSKKVRRVLPEHEGRYKITMPSGSTPRTKEILAKMKTTPVPPPKKTVFDRLGSEGLVTSTTEVESPRITITGLGNDIIKTGADKQPSSVFLRLGEKSQTPSSTTVVAPEKRVIDNITLRSDSEKTLPYVGILKPKPKVITAVSTKRKAPTMHADKELSGGAINKFRTQFTSNTQREVKNTLRLTKPTGFLGNHVNSSMTSVKARLGSIRTEGPSSSHTSTIKESLSTVVSESADNSVKKRVTFGGVSRVYPQESGPQPQFSRFRSDFCVNRGPRRGGVFNRLSL